MEFSRKTAHPTLFKKTATTTPQTFRNVRQNCSNNQQTLTNSLNTLPEKLQKKLTQETHSVTLHVDTFSWLNKEIPHTQTLEKNKHILVSSPFRKSLLTASDLLAASSRALEKCRHVRSAAPTHFLKPRATSRSSVPPAVAFVAENSFSWLNDAAALLPFLHSRTQILLRTLWFQPVCLVGVHPCQRCLWLFSPSGRSAEHKNTPSSLCTQSNSVVRAFVVMRSVIQRAPVHIVPVLLIFQELPGFQTFRCLNTTLLKHCSS